jgi:small GTP-binding protein
MSLRIVTGGNVDAGKSTFTACLFGEKDDGNGAARATMFTHLHEKESGRTSSVTIREGTVANRHVVMGDLPGHDKYFKTTIAGLTGLMADYVIIVVAANRGVTSITREHFRCAICMNLPIIVVMTKIDIAPKQILADTKHKCKLLVKKHHRRLYPVLKTDFSDNVVEGLVARGVVPMIQVSCVTQTGFDIFYAFFQKLPIWRTYDLESACSIQLESIFHVHGVGIVVGGVCIQGEMPAITTAYLGPFKNGEFKTVRVKSIFTEDSDSAHIQAGQYGTCAIAARGLRRKHISKGMCLTTDKKATAVKKMTARIFILHHATTVKVGYKPILHCRTLKMAAAIITMNKDVVRSGDYAKVTMEFDKPVFVMVGDHFVFRESKSKGVGKIISIH